MRSVITGLAAAILLAPVVGFAKDKDSKMADSVHDFKMKSLDGKPVDLASYKGKVLLIVNTASECGLTPQYEGLQALHDKYKDKGLAVLGFPCNDFGAQEPGSAAQIKEFCSKNYGVSFDMFAKVAVKGEAQCELYKYLTSKETNPNHAGPIGWNFAKFLVDRDGKVIARFDPRVDPMAKEVVGAVEKELGDN